MTAFKVYVRKTAQSKEVMYNAAYLYSNKRVMIIIAPNGDEHIFPHSTIGCMRVSGLDDRVDIPLIKDYRRASLGG